MEGRDGWQAPHLPSQCLGQTIEPPNLQQVISINLFIGDLSSKASNSWGVWDFQTSLAWGEVIEKLQLKRAWENDMDKEWPLEQTSNISHLPKRKKIKHATRNAKG